MRSHPKPSTEAGARERRLPDGTWVWLLIGLGLISAAVVWHLASLSALFAFGSDRTQRPILSVLLWLGIAFVLHLLALGSGLRWQRRDATALVVIVFAVVFRVIMLQSEPIQEVDIYRYLWDGIVSQTGVSPYKYTPQQVIDARGKAGCSEDLTALAKVGNSSEAVRDILARVHYGSVPTVYPPASQWGFHLVQRLTPNDATLAQRLMRMRIWLVLADLATLLVLLAILKRTDRHPAFAILYGWSPLVIKEFANSGHLDSMTILCTTIGIYFCVRLLQRPNETKRITSPAMFDALGAAAAFALGIGAKIYPVVLLPWFATLTIRRLRLAAIVPLATVGILALLILKPMFFAAPQEAESTSRPSDGIKTFFKYWEMNDFLYLITVENLRPNNEKAVTPWFVFVPNSVREWAAATLESLTRLPRAEATFQGARIITTTIFAAIVLWLCCNAWQANTTQAWLRAAFLSLAWFWLLCPTQNPWYWIWVMPLLPFAKYRAWYLVSGITMVYYLRFWFEYHLDGVPVWNTPYRGTLFFDFVITWLEFAPWLALLAAEAVWRRAERGCGGIRTCTTPGP